MAKKDQDDPIEFANSILDQIIAKHDPEAIAETGRDPKKVAAGLKGGSKGGHARSNNLTPKKRKEIAKKAIETRWSKKPSQD